ncbi:MAG: hypothetical protein AAF335_05055 [Bacteroidota bacterium]
MWTPLAAEAQKEAQRDVEDDKKEEFAKRRKEGENNEEGWVEEIFIR